MDDGCVLIVEADVLVRSSLADYLRDCGYTVFETSDGQQARELLDDAAAVIDIVLADVNGSKENGFALAVWIRANYPAVEVVLAGTAATAVEKAAQICQEGPALAIPYDHQLVHERIRRLVAARNRGGKTPKD
ncbi:MAG TPA: response regulator [Methylovirgula sp.]